MGDFLQLLISGTATGAMYALAALAFALAYMASMLVLGAGFKLVVVDPIIRFGTIPRGNAAAAAKEPAWLQR